MTYPSQRSEYRRAYYARNVEKARANARAWYWANREQALASGKERRERDADLTREYQKEWGLTSRHNLTHERRREILDRQSFLCPGCLTDLRLLESVNVTVDHDHGCCDKDRSCGKCIRGIVCRKCNMGLGLLRDSAEILHRLANYLERESKS